MKSIQRLIPILLLISFLTNDTLAIEEVITKTLISAILIILYMFVIGKKVINWLLKCFWPDFFLALWLHWQLVVGR